MTDLDNDFGAEDEINPFDVINQPNQNGNHNNHQPSPQTNLGPNYDEESDDEDDDLKKLPKYKELDDSGDELDQNEKQMQQRFKQNFNNLFANNSNIDKEDCVVQEEGMPTLPANGARM